MIDFPSQEMLDVRDDPDDPRRRWLRILPVRMRTEGRFAVFAVDELQRILPLERDNNNNNHSPSAIPQRHTGLLLHGQNRFHDDAVEVFCNYLRQPTCELTALDLCQLPRQQYRLLLQALHHNTSVKELHVHWRRNDVGIVGIIELLRMKTDFEALCLYSSCFCISQILPFLRQDGSLRHLRKLRLEECSIDDRGLELMIQALVDGNHHRRLEVLSLCNNEITSRGLAYLCVALLPSLFPHLQKLLLGHNRTLLDEPEITQRFVFSFLLAQDATTLKELDISYCCSWAVAYFYFLKALETNRTLLALNISDDELPGLQPIRNQFVDCLPKMKALQHLIVTPEQHIFNDYDKELKMAFHRNASLFKLSTKTGQPLTLETSPFLLFILKRNKQLAYIDHLLPPTATAGGPNDITIPRGRWSRVLAQVGQGPEGASPVYKILRAALASWPEVNQKHSHQRRTTSVNEK